MKFDTASIAQAARAFWASCDSTQRVVVRVVLGIAALLVIVALTKCAS